MTPRVTRIRAELTTLAIEVQALGNRLQREGPQHRCHAAAVQAQAEALAETCRELADSPKRRDADGLALNTFFPLPTRGGAGDSNDDGDGGTVQSR